MNNIRYIFIIGLILVTLIISYAFFHRYFGNIFNFTSSYRNLEGACLDKCPYILKCAAQESSQSQQRCFLQCKEICQLNPLDIPSEYNEDNVMKAFYGTS